MIADSIYTHENERLRALKGDHVFGTSPEVAFDELVVLAARICGTPISLITLGDQEEACVKAHHGIGAGDVPRALSFCTHVLAKSGEFLLVPDAALDLRFADNPFVTGSPAVRFYASAPLCTPEGNVIGTLCVIDVVPRSLSTDQAGALRVLGRQVVAQLELQRCLREVGFNNARLEKSQKLIGLGDWEYDFLTHRMFWSDEVYRILGLERSDCTPSCEAFESRVHPDDLALFLRLRKAVEAGKPRADFEHRIVRPDGKVRHVHHVAEMIFDDQGRPAGETGTIKDVTDRRLADTALRESEERFKFVARAVSDVVWDWNLETNTLWWNDGFLTTFGFCAGEILPDIKFWTGRIHVEERARVMERIHRAIETGAEKWDAEYRFQRKDGSYALVGDRGYILRNATGRGVRMVGGMRDLTEQQAREAQHFCAQRMESIGTLAGGIAHDLNNVLAPILMSIEMLKLSSGDDPSRLKILDTIHASCNRGAGLVRQVLAFARGLEGQRVALGLRALIVDLEGIIGEIFPRNIRIATKLPGSLWPITGDPTQIHQVLLNLAVNARDAMPLGGTLTLTAANVSLSAGSAANNPAAGAGPYVLLQVIDTGAGILAAVRERMFEPFFTTKEFGKGTGLGLAIVHTIIKSHGGFLHVESEVGQGTTFSLWLPATPDAPIIKGALDGRDGLPRGHGELVLVVDDEESIRDVTGLTLKAFGYRVLLAKDGAEAVALYAQQTQQIAVVLTDMMMPVMDGPTAIRELRRINPNVKVIMASGFNSLEKLDDSMRADFHDFLPKPFTAEELLRSVRDILDRPPSRTSETRPPSLKSTRT